jgi:hypothetical protein
MRNLASQRRWGEKGLQKPGMHSTPEARQEDQEFKVSLSYIVRSYLKKIVCVDSGAGRSGKMLQE